jgi:hypothetical protein
VGKAISEIKRGAALAAKVSPNPIKKLQHPILGQFETFLAGVATRAYRAPMNIPTEWEAVWTMVATIMMDAPIAIAGRRPRPSER